jgi:hypothetical protein
MAREALESSAASVLNPVQNALQALPRANERFIGVNFSTFADMIRIGVPIETAIRRNWGARSQATWEIES